MTPNSCPKPDLEEHRAGLIRDIKATEPQTPMWFARITALGQLSEPYRNSKTGCQQCGSCQRATPPTT